MFALQEIAQTLHVALTNSSMKPIIANNKKHNVANYHIFLPDFFSEINRPSHRLHNGISHRNRSTTLPWQGHLNNYLQLTVFNKQALSNLSGNSGRVVSVPWTWTYHSKRRYKKKRFQQQRDCSIWIYVRRSQFLKKLFLTEESQTDADIQLYSFVVFDRLQIFPANYSVPGSYSPNFSIKPVFLVKSTALAVHPFAAVPQLIFCTWHSESVQRTNHNIWMSIRVAALQLNQGLFRSEGCKEKMRFLFSYFNRFQRKVILFYYLFSS